MPSKSRQRPRAASAEQDSPAAAAPIPALWTDPSATLITAAIEVEAIGRVWTVPPMSAAQWLDLIWSDGLTFYDIFPGLVGADDMFTEAMLAGDIGMEEMFALAQEIIETGAGLRWWVTLNLAMQAKVNWHNLGGALIREGLDARTMPLGAWLLSFLSLCLENMKPEKAAKFVTDINTPPKGTAKEETKADDGAAFLAAMRQAL